MRKYTRAKLPVLRLSWSIADLQRARSAPSRQTSPIREL